MVSVVIPAYNEEAVIERTVRTVRAQLERSGAGFEILVVDDGSRDGTYAKVRGMAETGGGDVRGIRLSRNFGKEGAILAGLAAARGDAVITIDADLQQPPDLIPEMIGRWRAGAKVVHAVKRERTGDSFLTRHRATLFNRAMTRLGGIDMENASDYKLLDRVVVDLVVTALREKRRFYRGLAQWVGFEQESIPFDVAARPSGEGKFSLGALLDLGVTAIVSFTTAPLRIVTFLGIITLGFAVVVAAETLWSVYRGESVSGFPTLIIAVLLIGSIVMISLGIIGEYIAKIYEESKGRPTYIVSSRCGFGDGERP
jgi:glycosyltransferase involved in cell wall biosynthesis